MRCQEIATKRWQHQSALVRSTITAPSALVRQFSHHHKSEHHQAVVSRPWSGRLVWRWAVNASARLACVTDVLLSSAPHTLSPSSTRPRRHCQAGCSFGAVAPWPLQRCSCGFAGDDTSPSTENLACSRTYCTVQDLAPRPFHSCPAGVALVADHRENTVQAVPAQDVCRARSRLHCQPVDLTPASDIPSRSSLHSSSNCDLVVLRTSRKSDV